MLQSPIETSVWQKTIKNLLHILLLTDWVVFSHFHFHYKSVIYCSKIKYSVNSHLNYNFIKTIYNLIGLNWVKVSWNRQNSSSFSFSSFVRENRCAIIESTRTYLSCMYVLNCALTYVTNVSLCKMYDVAISTSDEQSDDLCLTC